MNWFTLFWAGVFEIVWAIGMKYSKGFTVLWPSVITVIAMTLSFILLIKASAKLPIGTAYAVWTGIGAAGTAVLGIYLFKEPCTPARIASLALVVAGITGLKLFE